MLFRDEAAAWAAAVGGDADGFAAVFDLNLERTYRHALRIVGNTHDAEDLTAAAFLELWRRRRQVRVVEESVLPWLFVTVANLARNRSRGVRRYRRFLASLPRSEATGPSPDDEVVGQEAARVTSERVRGAFSQLDRSQAALVSLVAFEDYSPSQAAQALGITPAAARTRLHRARRQLEAILAVEEPG